MLCTGRNPISTHSTAPSSPETVATSPTVRREPIVELSAGGEASDSAGGAVAGTVTDVRRLRRAARPVPRSAVAGQCLIGAGLHNPLRVAVPVVMGARVVTSP